jgi:hypothetical protein
MLLNKQPNDGRRRRKAQDTGGARGRKNVRQKNKEHKNKQTAKQRVAGLITRRHVACFDLLFV